MTEHYHACYKTDFWQHQSVAQYLLHQNRENNIGEAEIYVEYPGELFDF